MMNRFNVLKSILFLLVFIHGGVVLNAQSCNVAIISAANGENTIYTCPGDGMPDAFQFINEGANSTANFRYVATDDAFNIIGLPPANTIDFEGAGEGICYVWGFNFTGNVLAQLGQNIFSTRFSDGCYAISRTAVKVVRATPNGGMVAMPSGRTQRMVCTTDGFNDVVVFTNNSTSNAQYRYIITDDQNNILGLPPTNSLNFEGVFPGVCRVWGLSYTGNLTAQLGDNAAITSLTDGCFDLSDNFITVTRTDVAGGTVATANGMTSITTRASDGIPDVVMFSHVSESDADFSYIVTDANNKIIGTPPGNMVNFEDAGEGVCRVWGVSYTGELRYLLGGTIGDFALSTGCYEISENFVTVNRINELSGGNIAMPDGNTIRYTCPGDAKDDIVRFVSSNATLGATFAYVITDNEGNILGLPPTAQANLEGAGEGICFVWGLSYTGNLTAQVGQNALNVALSDGDFALSEDVITINRFVPDGGNVSTVAGEREITTIAGDGNDDIIAFASTDATLSRFRYVVTDQAGVIIGLPPVNMVNFEEAGTGVCLVWGLAYTGQFTAALGDNALRVALSDECFDLSTTFVTVNRVSPRTAGLAKTTVQAIQIFPNPTSSEANIQFQHHTNASATVRVLDQLGRVVLQNTTDVFEGFNQVVLNVTSLTAGTYFVQIQTDELTQQSILVKK